MKAPARIRALNCAVRKIGVTEHPPGSNRGRIIDSWNLEAGAPVGSYWCCSFVHACFKTVGVTLPGGASVGALLGQAHSRGWVVKRPLKGDLACFDFGENNGFGAYGDHIGFVEKVIGLRWKNGVFAGYIATVEGNTSSGVTGSQSNGGGVYRRRRLIARGVGAAFVRVP